MKRNVKELFLNAPPHKKQIQPGRQLLIRLLVGNLIGLHITLGLAKYGHEVVTFNICSLVGFCSGLTFIYLAFNC